MEHTVATTGGRVQGIETSPPGEAGRRVSAFLGIPYAAPPFGENRLRAPAPAAPWDGVRTCAEFGPIPPQPTGVFPGVPEWSPATGEDVLTLNIWSPDPGASGLPVLVWIYGGAYLSGSAADPAYEGTRLAQAGLVVVTLNYRVGFEGFGHVPGAPDDRGLLDQVAALRWIADNIAAFGGDPGNVTVGGESAGAGAAACLPAMPAARGLFHRTIVHSAPSEYFTTGVARGHAERVAAAAGAEYRFEALAATPPQDLISASLAVTADYNADPDAGIRYLSPTVYGPVVDGEILPDGPLQALRSGGSRNVDLLVCHTLHEFRLFPALGMAPQISTEDGLAAAAEAVGLPADRVPRYRELLGGATVPDTYPMLVGDGLFAEYTTRLAEAHAEAGGRAFLSRFTWQSRIADGALGACHGADVPFVFGNLTEGPGSLLLGEDGPTDADRALSDRMIEAWAGFAASGDPGWPSAEPDKAQVHLWGTKDDLVPEDTTGLRELWRDVEFAPQRA